MSFHDRTRVLIAAAHALIQDRPTCHTTFALARDQDGTPVNATSPYARCWCTRGLFLHIRGVDSLDHRDVYPATAVVLLAAVEFGFPSVSRCNDTLGRPGAVRMLARGVELMDHEDVTVLLGRAERLRPDLTLLKPLTVVGAGENR